MGKNVVEREENDFERIKKSHSKYRSGNQSCIILADFTISNSNSSEMSFPFGKEWKTESSLFLMPCIMYLPDKNLHPIFLIFKK